MDTPHHKGCCRGHSHCGEKDTEEPAMPIAAETAEESSNAAAEAALDNEIEQMRLQAAEYKDKYLRGLAESENSRKRMQKERQELVQYAIQNALADFLSPIDHLENALQFAHQAAPEVQHWAVGFQMILGQFKDALVANGVTTIESVGKPFDHNLHEAIEMVETDQFPAGIVIEETLRGYKIGERLLRPARVKVAKASEPVTETDIEAQD
jgi:molecular chaperone GrpE